MDVGDVLIYFYYFIIIASYIILVLLTSNHKVKTMNKKYLHRLLHRNVKSRNEKNKKMIAHFLIFITLINFIYLYKYK